MRRADQAVCAEGRSFCPAAPSRCTTPKARGAPGGIFTGRAGARHLLRHADHGRAAGRPGRIVQSSRIRCGAGAADGRFAAARRPRGQPRCAGRRVLDVWMSHGDRVVAVPPGFKVIAVERQCAARGHGGRVAAILRRAVSSRGHPHPAGRRDPAALRARDRRLRGELGDGEHHRGQCRAHPRASRARTRCCSASRAAWIPRCWPRCSIAPSAHSSPVCSWIMGCCGWAKAIR